MTHREPETHGDGFAPHPQLAAFSRRMGGTFFYDTMTETMKVPVVLIHGNGDEADTWRHILPALATTHRVIAPDLPGFGRSLPRDSGDLRALAASVLELIDALELQRVALVGSSLGGAVASVVAIALQERTSSLTIIGGPVPGLPESQPEINLGLQAMLEPGVGEAYYTGLRDQGQDAAYQSLEPYYANLAGLSASDQSFLRQRVWARVWSDAQRTAFFAALRSMFKPSQAASRLETTPLQLIWGERDQIVPITVAHDILAAVPHARLEVIPGAGHLPHQEKPEAVLSVLHRFLA
jgi:pimeloyl-ACP methyl ester carboxylesterase